MVRTLNWTTQKIRTARMIRMPQIKSGSHQSKLVGMINLVELSGSLCTPLFTRFALLLSFKCNWAIARVQWLWSPGFPCNFALFQYTHGVLLSLTLYYSVHTACYLITRAITVTAATSDAASMVNRTTAKREGYSKRKNCTPAVSINSEHKILFAFRIIFNRLNARFVRKLVSTFDNCHRNLRP